MFLLKQTKPRVPVYVNYNDFDTDRRALVPEVWAPEGLRILEENLVYGNLVHREFSDQVASYGDVINTRRPGKFTARRKVDGDTIELQPATADKIQIPLDQHVYTSFIIYDEEHSKSFKELRTMFLVPAIRSIARQIDSIIDAVKYEFAHNIVGKLGTDPTKTTVIGLQTKANNLLMPPENRLCVIPPDMQGSLLHEQQFTDADKFGDGGSAIRNGSLGRLYGSEFIMSQNNKAVPALTDVTSGTVNLTAGYGVGTTSMVVNNLSAAITNGTWFTVAGDMTPQYVVSTVGGATPTTIVFSPGLKSAVVDTAAITLMDPGAVDLTAGYAANYNKRMVTKTFTTDGALQGQMVSMGSAASLSALERYGALAQGVDASNVAYDTKTNMLLNRSLVAAAADDETINVGPAGAYGFFFHPEAVAFVSRPLTVPPSGMGAESFVASANGLGLRITMQYNAAIQGTYVTVDLLCGVKKLDDNLGILMLG